MFTLGGATLGYCATGSTRIDAAPASMITIEITHANTGRLAKNLASMSVPRSGGASGRTARGGAGPDGCGARPCGTRPGAGSELRRMHRHAGADLVRAIDDDLVAVLEALFHQ